MKEDKSLQRRVIRERIYSTADWQIPDELWLFGKIEEIIQELSQLRKNLKRKFKEYQWFELEPRDEYEEDCRTVCVGCRWETDQEYNKRIDRLKANRARREARK